MRIAILQHVPHEGPAALDEWTRARGHEKTDYPLYQGQALPAPAAFECLVVLGGGMSVHDTGIHAWIEPERVLIRAAMAERIPVIGICLGAQQLAHALGARVVPNPVREVGFWPIRRVGDALPLPAETTALHWHGDTFDLPEDAYRLAASDACRNQIFVTGDGLGLGLQCHLEATPQWIDACCTHDADYLIPGPWMQDAARLRAERAAYPTMHAALFDLLDAFLDCARRAGEVLRRDDD
ncbi:glutamine amidotransferase class-I [Thioalkalivibrio nitratireducens DSM 14787]|uniref:Glutamine amidotransferase class-I n=1 Tax=Thioalkalivibrio nitratireducens (strain DSM 14787 / UNIQEM 213 / ALEN2) TaxID=1255043 RepID=L0E2G3_THIND|nr:type 1 glutamine amidotransferase [Thioalkalivibrio nitratireducens]AGA34841.1 glutamine amidotransferase class-I [Thioalkalivibrio nitratireducens DSM 14787]